MLEDAVATEDGLVYDEPEPWHLPARHVLGAVMIEDGRYQDAERVYREALEDHPHTGWALFGLQQALHGMGKMEDADRAYAEFKKRWERSDIWLRSSRY